MLFNFRNALIWSGLALLAIAAIFCVRSTLIAVLASAIALLIAVALHRHRRQAGHVFVFSHAVLMGGSALLLLTVLAMTETAFRFLERTLAKIFMTFFQAFGAFTWIYIIFCVILMAFILASQRDR